MRVLNVAFYRFADLGAHYGPAEMPALRAVLLKSCQELGLRGTILLSPEGINVSLSGNPENIWKQIEKLRALPGMSGLKSSDIKQGWSDSLAFGLMLVKLKKEIIAFGRPEVRPAEFTGPRLEPQELKKWLDEGRDVVLLDTRNQFEVDVGTFESARSLNLKNFREFPEKLQNLSKSDREKPIVMFCTGGIRCEKATAFALQAGFENVYQLEGGILRYFDECGDAHYQGGCFVFDERVAVHGQTVADAPPLA